MRTVWKTAANSNTKYWVSFAVMVIGLLGAAKSILIIQNEGMGNKSMAQGMTLLLTSVAVGVGGVLGRIYYRTKRYQQLQNADDIAIKTLGELGRQRTSSTQSQPQPDESLPLRRK